MLSDLEDIDLEELECHLYSQIHHPSNTEDEPIQPNAYGFVDLTVNDYNKYYKKRYYECDIDKRPRNISKNNELEVDKETNKILTNSGVIEFQIENNNHNVTSYNNGHSSPLQNGNSPMLRGVNATMRKYPVPQIYAIGSSNNDVILSPSSKTGNKRSKTLRKQRQKAKQEEYAAIIRAANENAEVFKNMSLQERRKVLRYQKRQRYIERRKERKKKEKEEKAIEEYNEQVEREIIVMDRPKSDEVILVPNDNKIICLSDSDSDCTRNEEKSKVNILSSDDEVTDDTVEKLYSIDDIVANDEVIGDEDDVVYVEPELKVIDIIDLDSEEPTPKSNETDAALMKPPSDFETMSMSSAQSVILTQELLKPSLTSTPTKQISILVEQDKTSSTPESSNDFLDVNIVRQNNYTFSQHGSDFDPSKCNKAKKTLGEIYGSESSCSTSDLSLCTKNIVFNEIEFDTPSKELFTETNLQSFGEFITPRRILAQSPVENDKEINKSSDLVMTKVQKSKKLPSLSHFETNIVSDLQTDIIEESAKRSEHSTASDSSSESEYEDSKIVPIDKKQNKGEEITKKGKKQKKCTAIEEEMSTSIKSKKRKSKTVDANETTDFSIENVEDSTPKKNKHKKKKKKKNEESTAENQSLIEEIDNNESSTPIKKKKKKKTQDMDEIFEAINSEESESNFGDVNVQNQSLREEKDHDDSLVSLKRKKRKKSQDIEETNSAKISEPVDSEELVSTSETTNAESQSSIDRVDYEDSLVSTKKKKKKKIQDTAESNLAKNLEVIESEESESTFIEILETGQDENESCEVSSSKKKRKKKKSQSENLQNDFDNISVSENDHVKKKRKRKKKAKKNLELSDSLRNVTDNDINENLQDNDPEAESKDCANEGDKFQSSLSSSSDIEIIESPMKSPILILDTEDSSIEQEFENSSPKKKDKSKKRSRNEIELHIDPEEVNDLLSSLPDKIDGSNKKLRKKRKRTETDDSLKETVLESQTVNPVEAQNVDIVELQIVGEIEHENEEIAVKLNKSSNEASDISKSNTTLDNSATAEEGSSSDVEIIETQAKSPIVIDDLDDELNLPTDDSPELDLATNYLIIDETNCEDVEAPQAEKTKQIDYPKRFSDYWTEDQEKFHEHNWNYEHFNLPDIHKTMTSDPLKWKIITKDRLLIKSSGPRCKRCREFGHVSYYCQANVIRKCNLCGGKGHSVPRCPNKICTQCGRNTKFSITRCHNCAHLRHSICSLCNQVGHESSTCPDQWRRYHLTTEEGPIVESKSKLKLVPTQNRWCSGCAKKGHFEYTCKYYNRTHPPSVPFIINYKELYGFSKPHTQVQDNETPHAQSSSSQQQITNTNMNFNQNPFSSGILNPYNNFVHLPSIQPQIFPLMQQRFMGIPNPIFNVGPQTPNIFIPTHRPMVMNSIFPEPIFNIGTNPGTSSSITINNNATQSKAICLDRSLANKTLKKIGNIFEVLHSLKKRTDGYYIDAKHQSKFDIPQTNVMIYAHFGLEDGEKHMECLLDTLDAIRREQPFDKNQANNAISYLFFRHRTNFKYMELLGQTVGMSSNEAFVSNLRKTNEFSAHIKTMNYKANFLLKYKEGCLFLEKLKRRVQVLIYQTETEADVVLSSTESANVIYAEIKMNLYLARIPCTDNFPTSRSEIYKKLNFEIDDCIKLGHATDCVSLYEQIVREEQLLLDHSLRNTLNILFTKLHSIMFLRYKYSPEYYATLVRWRDKLKLYRDNKHLCDEDLIEIKNAYFYIFDNKRKYLDYQKFLYIFRSRADNNECF